MRGSIIPVDSTIEEGTRLAVFEPNQRSPSAPPSSRVCCSAARSTLAARSSGRVFASAPPKRAAGTARWWLVDKRTGSREARFVGRLDWDAVWEDDQHFLTAAQGEDGKAALVRCDVAGACERASRLWDVPVPPDPSTFYAAPPVLLVEE